MLPLGYMGPLPGGRARQTRFTHDELRTLLAKLLALVVHLSIAAHGRSDLDVDGSVNDFPANES